MLQREEEQLERERGNYDERRRKQREITKLHFQLKLK
jgi:hypothetical protein